MNSPDAEHRPPTEGAEQSACETKELESDKLSNGTSGEVIADKEISNVGEEQVHGFTDRSESHGGPISEVEAAGVEAAPNGDVNQECNPVEGLSEFAGSEMANLHSPATPHYAQHAEGEESTQNESHSISPIIDVEERAAAAASLMFQLTPTEKAAPTDDPTATIEHSALNSEHVHSSTAVDCVQNAEDVSREEPQSTGLSDAPVSEERSGAAFALMSQITPEAHVEINADDVTKKDDACSVSVSAVSAISETDSMTGAPIDDQAKSAAAFALMSQISPEGEEKQETAYEVEPDVGASRLRPGELDLTSKDVDETSEPTKSPSRPPPPAIGTKSKIKTLPHGYKLRGPSKTGLFRREQRIKPQSKDDQDRDASSERQPKSGGPFSGVMKSIRKSFTKRSKSNVSKPPAPQRIDGRQTSPRIVSSLRIDPPHTYRGDAPLQSSDVMPVEFATPDVRRRQLLSDITNDLLEAMPPTPTDIEAPVIKSAPEIDSEAVPSSDTNGDVISPSETVQECSAPSRQFEVEEEPIEQSVVEQKALIILQQMLKSMEPPADTQVTAEVSADVQSDLNTGTLGRPRPPRPVSPPPMSPLDYQPFHSEEELTEPAVVRQRLAALSPEMEDDQHTYVNYAGAPSDIHDAALRQSQPLPIPPRPREPPKVEVHQGSIDDEIIISNESTVQMATPSLAITPPIYEGTTEVVESPETSTAVMRAAILAKTASLDRRKLYRTKTENKQIKHETAARTATLKDSLVQAINRSSRGDPYATSPRPPKPIKTVVERREVYSFTLRRPKSKGSSQDNSDAIRPISANTAMAAPPRQRSATLKPSVSFRPASTAPGLKFIDDEPCVMQNMTHSFTAPPRTPTMASIGIQTAPMRPDKTPLRPITSLRYTEAAYRSAAASDQHQGTCVQEDNGIHLPFISPKQSDVPTRPSEAACLESMLANQNDSTKAMLQVHPFLQSWRPLHKLDHQDCPNSIARQESHDNGSDNESSKKTVGTTLLSHQHVINCLEQYMTASVELRSADIQGEFAAFHWLAGDLEEAGWSSRGAPLGWPSLKLYHDPIKHTEFIKLPRISGKPGTLVYPDRIIDNMLVSWLDCKSTMLGGKLSASPDDAASPTSTPSPTDEADDLRDMLHPATAIVRLDELLARTSEKTAPHATLLSSVGLAVLLSLDYCLRNAASVDPETGKASMSTFDLNPANILILAAPNNCLVLFRHQRHLLTPGSTDQEGTLPTLSENTTEDSKQRLKPLLDLLCLDCWSIEAGLDECVDNIHRLATSSLEAQAMLPCLLKALAPPDWIAMIVARICLLRI